MMNRLPKIGIRPAIDGRRGGIRESLEEKTMGMARAAARIVSENLRHASGEKIEVILADTTIGGVAENVACAEKFEKAGVDITLTVSPCWCYGTETMDMSPNTIKAVWGFNGTERPGAVYLAAVLAAHNQKGLPAFAIYGKDVQDLNDSSVPEDVKKKILLFCKAAIAAATVRGKSYLSIGSVAMGIAGSIPNHEFFQDYLGMRNEQVDTAEILRRMKKEIYDKDEYEKAVKWARKNCTEGFDKNPAQKAYSREKKEEQWAFAVKMMMIFRDLMHGNPKLDEMGWKEEACGHEAICGGFQGQRQWTDFLPNGDFPEAMLNTSFDWNGVREAIPFATENDTLNGAAMLLGHLLTDRAQLFADVRTYWSPEAVERVTGRKLTGLAENGMIHMINSGAAALDANGKMKDADGKPVMKPFWEITPKDVEHCLKGTDWCPADVDYFRGGGFSSRFIGGSEGGMPMTMVRINLIKGVGPVLQLAEGYSCSVDPEIHKQLDQRTDPTWPTTWFAPKLTGKGVFTDVYSVMANWNANHAALSYGHVGDLLITLCSILRIPVCMHNVERERIFRPTYWSCLGTEDLEGADYRACKALGSRYGI